MADYVDVLADKKKGAKIRRGGFVWRKKAENCWVCTSDGEEWETEDLAEYLEELDWERKELNFDD